MFVVNVLVDDTVHVAQATRSPRKHKFVPTQIVCGIELPKRPKQVSFDVPVTCGSCSSHKL